jgi:AcrR family transcriptional regulator
MHNNIRTYSKDEELIASRRRHIARCAAHLFVKHGYDSTSVREIAEACNMSMGSLYRYIGTKEDILYLVMSQGLYKFLEFCHSVETSTGALSPPETLQQAIRKFYQIVDEIQDVVLFSYQDTKNLEPQAQQRIFDLDRQVVAAFEKLLTKGCETGDFKIHNVTMVAHDIVAIGGMWAVRRWFLRKYCTLEEYIKEHSELILRAISQGKTAVKNTK